MLPPFIDLNLLFPDRTRCFSEFQNTSAGEKAMLTTKSRILHSVLPGYLSLH